MSRAGTDVDVTSALRLALRLADQADHLAMAGFRTDHGVDIKADGSPVTRVDREVEASLRDMIETAMPSTAILGEEYGETHGDEGRWIIDPIDGTVQFAAGDPRFSVLIAYEVDDRPLVGVVSAPALGLRWWAAAGGGARLSKRGEVSAARVSTTRRPERAVGMFLGGSDDGADGISSRAVRLGGSGIGFVSRAMSWEAVRVSSGEFDLAMTTGAVWDVAPLPIIISEAGGVATLLENDGGRFSYLFSNKRLSESIAELV